MGGVNDGEVLHGTIAENLEKVSSAPHTRFILAGQ